MKNLHTILDAAHKAFQQWKDTSFADRQHLLSALADIFEAKRSEFAQTITGDMHKPLSQALAEVDKCKDLLLFYAQCESPFAESCVQEKNKETSVSVHPLGIITQHGKSGMVCRKITKWNGSY